MSDADSGRVRAYAEAFRARKGPRCAQCVELDDWSDCAECDAVVAVEVADRGQAGLRAEVERWRGRADRRLAEAKKAEAEKERLTHLLGSHADGHRCTCTMIDPGNFHVEGGNAHPPEWEQDPWCPTHPDVNQIKGDLRNLAEDWANEADANEDFYPREAKAFRKAAQELFAVLPSPKVRADGHVCAECPDCTHDGNRCCGCYDGACCLRGPEPTEDGAS